MEAEKKKGKGRRLLLAMVLAGILAGLASAPFFAAWFINRPPAKERIEAWLSKAMGGEVRYGSLSFSLIPSPALTVHRGRLRLPGRLEMGVEALRITPLLRPLLERKIRLSKVWGGGPRLVLELHGQEEKAEGRPGIPGRQELLGYLGTAWGAIASIMPQGLLRVERGEVEIRGPKGLRLGFQEIEGTLRNGADRVHIQLCAASPLAETIRVDLAAESETVQGSVALHKVLLGQVSPLLKPIWEGDLHGYPTDLAISFRLEGVNDLEADLRAETDRVGAQWKGRALEVQNMALDLGLRDDPQGIVLTLRQLSLGDPPGRLSGEFRLDKKRKTIQARAQGTSLDMAAWETQLAGLLEGIPKVKETLSYLGGGEIEELEVLTQGERVEDLLSLEGIEARGRVSGLILNLPRLHGPVREIAGEFRLSQGVLHGSDLHARWKKCLVREGILSVGLLGVPGFSWEGLVRLDVGQALPVGLGLLREAGLAEGLEQWEKFTGRMSARLLVERSEKRLVMNAEGLRADVSGPYQGQDWHLVLEDGSFSFAQEGVEAGGVSGSLGACSFSNLGGSFGLGGERLLHVQAQSVRLDLDEVRGWLGLSEGLRGRLSSVRTAGGEVRLSEFELKMPLKHPKEVSFKSQGLLENVRLMAEGLPGPLEIPSGGFEATEKSVSFKDMTVKILESQATATGEAAYSDGALQSFSASGSGTLSQKGVDWLRRAFNLPGAVVIHAPVDILSARVDWHKEGGVFQGTIIPQGGPTIHLEMALAEERISVRRVEIRDEVSHVEGEFELGPSEVSGRFQGALKQETIQRLVKAELFGAKSIQGDLRLRTSRARPWDLSAQGRIRAENVRATLPSRPALILEAVSLRALGRRLEVNRLRGQWGEALLGVSGTILFSPESLHVEMLASLGRVDLEEALKAFRKERREEESIEDSGERRMVPIHGTVRVRADSVCYGRLSITPFRAEIRFVPREISVVVKEAILCGISLPATVRWIPEGVALDLKIHETDKPVEGISRCLLEESIHLDGMLEAKAHVKGVGPPRDLLKSLKGPVTLTARQGHIHRFTLLSRIVEFLNVSRLVKGKLPDPREKGMAYDVMQLKGYVQDGRLEIREWLLDADSLDMAGEGQVDFLNKTLDLRLAVAPLKTANLVVQMIPLVRDVLGGMAVAVPVRISGPWKDPTIFPLDPRLVGAGLLRIMERTLKLPLKALKPFLPKEEKEKP